MATTLLSPSIFSASVLHSNNSKFCHVSSSIRSSKPILKGFKVRAIKEKTEEMKNPTSSSAEEVTKKYGLEAGLWQLAAAIAKRKFTFPAPAKDIAYMIDEWDLALVAQHLDFYSDPPGMKHVVGAWR